MRGLVFDGTRALVRDDLPEPVVDATRTGNSADAGPEALIALRVGGVCATDLELVKGYMDFSGVLGHEWVGDVVAADDPQWLGQRVVGGINAACGRCATCAAGMGSHCPHRTVLGIDGRDGAFSERFRLPVANLLRVPAHVADDAAVFVEPLAAACEITQQVHVRPGDRAVVLGAGRLGNLCAQVLALTGARVDVVNRSAGRLELLPDGIGRVLLGDAATLAGADVVVDCTGSAAGLSLATSLVRPRGAVVMKTTVHAPEAVTPIPWVINEIRLVGSRCGPFAPALRLLAAGLVDPTPLITGRFSLDEGVAALDAAASATHTKVLLTP